MGVCCSRLDQIENANTMDDLYNIICSDKEMFIKQFNIAQKDTFLKPELKEKKLEYIKFIIDNYNKYISYIEKISSRFNEVEIFEMKFKYKRLTKELCTLQVNDKDTVFKEFEEILYNRQNDVIT